MSRSTTGPDCIAELPPLLTVAEVAEILRTTPQAIYRRIRRGSLARIRDGRRVLVPSHAIEGIVGRGRRLDADGGSLDRGPRGQEPRVHTNQPCKPTERDWYSIVECRKGKARWAGNFYIYEGRTKCPKHIKRRSPHTSRAETQAWAQRLLTELGRPRSVGSTPAGPPSVRETCDRWFATQDRDQTNKRRHLGWLTQVWGADTMIDALDHEQITGLPAHLGKPRGDRALSASRRRRAEGNGRRHGKGDGLGPGTVRAICQTGSRVLEFAAQMGWRSAAKIPLPSVPVPDSEWFSIEELQAILTIAGPWRIVVLLGARAGLRRGEIVELRWQDVDLGHGRLRVARAYKQVDRDGTRVWTVGPPKSGRPRTVPIPPDLIAALAEIEGPGPQLVACTTAGERIEPWRLTTSIYQLATEAGITRPGIGAHALRHTYCSHLAHGGAATRAIQALAGHASLRTTERYMHLAPSHIEEAVTHLPFLGSAESLETALKLPTNARCAAAFRAV